MGFAGKTAPRLMTPTGEVGVFSCPQGKGKSDLLEDYKEAKECVLQCASDLLKSASVRENQFAGDLINTSVARLEGESFTLVILGEFKRGKSTLVNALLGAAVMPSALVPLTAIPTMVRYGEKPAARVLFENGNTVPIAVEDVKQYVAEKFNPKNVKNVREVTIEFPTARLKEGMVLVDTPGVGSVYQHNTDSAYGYLPYSDCAVFLISVDAPLSRVELEYLRDIQGHVRKIFYVLNKVDLVQPEDADEVLDFTRRVLAQNLGEEDVYLLPVSAKTALDAKLQDDAEMLRKSRVDVLEKDIDSFVRASKGALVLTAAANRLLKVVGDEETAQNLWRRAMDDTTEGLNEKIARFDKALAELEQEREDSIYLLYREIDRMAAQITERMEAYKRQNLPVLTARLQDYARDNLTGQSTKEAVATLHKYVIDLVQTGLERKKEEEWETIQAELAGLADRFFDRIESIVERLLQAAAKIFNLDVVSQARAAYVIGDRRIFFHFHEHPTFIPNLTDLPLFSVIPVALARGHVVKKATEKLEELLDRNTGRVRYNLTEKVRESVRKMAGDLRLRADALARGLKLALEDARRERSYDEAGRQAALAAREVEAARLARARAALEAVLAGWENRLVNTEKKAVS